MVVHELDNDTIPSEELTAVARTALRLLRAAALGALVVEHAKRISEWVAEVHGNAQDDDFEAIVEYILQATKERELMRAIYQHVSEQTQESLMSAADWLRAEGKAEGEARMLSRLLTQRFGELPRAMVARMRGASLPELERWASRLFSATSLDDVFAEP